MSIFNLKSISPRLIVLFCIVFGLGYGLMLDIGIEPPIEGQKISPEYFAAPTESRPRSPASIPSTSDQLSKWSRGDALPAFDWDCSKSVILWRDQHQIRVRGECLRGIRAITNTTNGYTANVFEFDRSVSTDYISLDEGTNRLKLEWRNGATANQLLNLDIVVEKQSLNQQEK